MGVGNWFPRLSQTANEWLIDVWGHSPSHWCLKPSIFRPDNERGTRSRHTMPSLTVGSERGWRKRHASVYILFPVCHELGVSTRQVSYECDAHTKLLGRKTLFFYRRAVYNMYNKYIKRWIKCELLLPPTHSASNVYIHVFQRREFHTYAASASLLKGWQCQRTQP